jgi:hypothetical protein
LTLYSRVVEFSQDICAKCENKRIRIKNPAQNCSPLFIQFFVKNESLRYDRSFKLEEEHIKHSSKSEDIHRRNRPMLKGLEQMFAFISASALTRVNLATHREYRSGGNHTLASQLHGQTMQAIN